MFTAGHAKTPLSLETQIWNWLKERKNHIKGQLRVIFVSWLHWDYPILEKVWISEKTCQQGQKSREDTEATSKLSPVTFLPEHRLQRNHVCPYLRLLETFSVLMIILHLFSFPPFPPSVNLLHVSTTWKSRKEPSQVLHLAQWGHPASHSLTVKRGHAHVKVTHRLQRSSALYD